MIVSVVVPVKELDTFFTVCEKHWPSALENVIPCRTNMIGIDNCIDNCCLCVQRTKNLFRSLTLQQCTA